MRRVLISLAIVLLVLATAIAAAAVWRAPLAEWAGREMLAREGYPEAEFQVETFTTERLVLRGIELGPEAPSAKRASARYSLSSLMDGRIEELALHEFRLDLDLTKDDPLAGLRPLIERDTEPATPGEAEAPRASFPRLLIEDARITVRDVQETVEIALDGTLVPENGDLRGDLQARAESPHTKADIELHVEQLLSAPDIRLSAQGQSDLSRTPWPQAWPLRPSGGTARFEVSLETSIPDTSTLPEPGTLFDHPASGRLLLDLREVDAKPLTRGLDAAAEFDVTLGGGSVRLNAARPLTVSTDSISEEALRDFGLPGEAAAVLAGARRATLSTEGENGDLLRLNALANGWNWESRAELRLELKEGEARLAFAGRGHHAADLSMQRIEADTLDLHLSDLSLEEHRLSALDYQGHLSATPEEVSSEGDLTVRLSRLALDNFILEDAVFDAPVGLSRIGETFAAELLAPARIEAARWPEAGPVRLDGGPSLTVREAQGTYAESGMTATLTVDPGRLSGHITREDAEPLQLRAEPGPLDLSLTGDGEGRMEMAGSLRDARVELPDVDLLAERIELDATSDAAQQITLRLAAGRIAHEAQEPMFSPLRAKADIAQVAGRFQGSGEIAVLGTQIALPFTLLHEPETGEGTLWSGPLEVAFAPGGPQPGTLSPLAKPIRNARGRLALDATVDWTPQGADGNGYVEFGDLSFDMDVLRVEGLQGRIGFARLLPPNSNGVQHLRAARAVVGVPVEDLTANFTIEGERLEDTLLQLHHAEARFAEGIVSLDEVTVRPDLDGLAFELDLQDISIAALLDQLDVEALSGEGRLSGSIPVRIENGSVVIEQGRLEAVSDGRLSAKLDQAGDALAQQGEQVGLMVRALENFRYERFAMTLTRPKTGRTELGMEIAGHNPEVLDGYPFEFNITFSGDIEPILLALQEGRRLSTDLMQEAIEGVR